MTPSTDDADNKSARVVLDEEEQAATVQVTWDAETERRLRWKCDRHVLPCITLLFFLSFLDRTNIGECRAVPVGLGATSIHKVGYLKYRANNASQAMRRSRG